MFDYTPEGIRATQGDLAIAYLNLIDAKLAKINRKLSIIVLLAVGTLVYRNKDAIIAFKNTKGE